MCCERHQPVQKCIADHVFSQKTSILIPAWALLAIGFANLLIVSVESALQTAC